MEFWGRGGKFEIRMTCIVNGVVSDIISSDLHADAMSLMQCRTRTALELSRTRRSANDRYYYETPKFDSAHAECCEVVGSCEV